MNVRQFVQCHTNFGKNFPPANNLKMSSVNTHSSPIRIPCEIGGTHAVAMYDTGSSCSFLSVPYLNWLFKNSCFRGPRRIKKYSGSIPISASNGPIDVLGEYSLRVKVGSVLKIVKFLISDVILDPCILGRDAIEAFGEWTIRPSTKDLLLKGNRIPFVDSYGSEEGIPVIVGESVTMPPRTIQMVELEIPKLEESLPPKLFIEPHPNFTYCSNLIGLSSVVSGEGKIATQVMNLGNEPQKLFRGDSFGQAETVDFEEGNGRSPNSKRKEGNPLCNAVTSQDRVKFLKEFV